MPGHIKKTSGPDPDPSPWVKPSSIIADSIILGILNIIFQLEVKDHIREAQKKKVI